LLEILPCWAVIPPEELAEGYLTEVGEIEVDGDGVAFGGNDFDGDRVGDECANGKLQIDGSAPRTARAIAAATIERAASDVGGRKNLVSVRHLDVKVSPEIIVTRDERGRRGCSRALRIRDHGAVRYWSDRFR